MGCPTDPLSIDSLLRGERPFRWRKGHEAEDRRRADQAHNTIAPIGQTLGHLGRGTEDAQLAAYGGLVIGLHANTAAANAARAKLAADARNAAVLAAKEGKRAGRGKVCPKELP